MKLSVITPLFILLIFTYLVFIFPFEILASWIGKPGSSFEIISSTLVVYFICLYYFRSKNSNKILKFFVYEGVGIGSVSLFIIIPLLLIELLLDIPDTVSYTHLTLPTILLV